MFNKKSLSKESKIRIADVITLVISEDASLGFRVDGTYRPFMTEGAPEVVLRFHCGEPTNSYDFGEKIFDSGTIWSLHRRNGKHLFRICYSGGNLTPDRIVILESNFRSGEVYISNRRSNQSIASDPLLYPLGELLMINLLSQGRGILTHSCALENNGEGMLFVGSSGAGKSTIAGLGINKKGVKILSDDRVIIRKRGDCFFMYGTPWHGDIKAYSSEAIFLEKIFFLRHAKKNTIKKITPVAATSRLIVCSFPTFWDKKGMEFTLKFCSELAQNIPSYELGFVPDESVLDFVKDECVRV